MQFTRETSPANVIRAWEHGRIRIGDRWLTGHVIVSADRILGDWAVAEPEELTIDALEPAIELRPEIIVLGTGVGALMPDLDLMSDLAARAIGLEVMDTRAACRTYNVLVHEQRRVVAALFNHRPASATAR